MQLADFFTEEHVLVGRLRDVILVPRNLELEVADDEQHKGRKKVVVKFSLQKGSYATIVTKSLFEQ